MRNIFLILFFFSFLYSCKPRPNLDIVVNASFAVTPNTKSIKLGDTLRLSLKAGANFPTINGGTYLFNDGTLSSPISIGEMDPTNSNGFRASDVGTFNIYAEKGIFERHQGPRTFGKIMANCINNEYNIDISIIPQKKDTFYIVLSRGNLFNNRTSVGADINFLGNNQHLEIVPLRGDTTKLYGFIVE